MSYLARIDRVTAHIRANLAGDLTLDTLADVAALSRFHFHRVFSAMTGETVADAVRRARLNRAAVLLAATDQPVPQIAMTCGYPRGDSFARAFRAAFGMTPGQARARRCVLPPLLPTQKGELPMFDVTIRTLPDAEAAALPHTGAYNQIGATFMKMGRLMAETGLGHHVQAGIGIYYDSPGQVPEAELRAHAGCIVPPGTPLPAGFDRVILPGGRTAVLTVRGPYSAIPAGWDYLYGTWLPRSGETPANRPPYELYPNDMATTPPEDLITEICVPLA